VGEEERAVTLNSARCLLAWIFAAILLFRGGNALLESFKARDWPGVQAVVTESDARWVEHHRPVYKSMWTYELHLRYAYTIRSREYIGSRASFSAWGPNENFNPLSSVIAKSLPVGKQVVAHYDPQDYSRSVVEPRVRPSVWIALALGLLMALLGVFYSRRVEGEKREARIQSVEC
jgi:hypothetical protein